MRRLLLLIVPVALAAGGYLLWRAQPEDGCGDAETVKREAPATSAEPLRLAGRSDETVPPAQRPAVPEGLGGIEGIELPEGASIEAPPFGSARAVGRVVDAEGKPVAGAHVEAVVAKAEQPVFVMPGGGASGPSVGTDTDAEGRFTIVVLAEGTDYDLVATTPTTYRATAGPFTASLEKPIEAEIRLPPSRWLDVRVVDAATKAPLADASVRWSAADDVRSEGIWALVVERVGEVKGNPKTDARGMIRIGPLPAAALELTALAKGYVRSPAPVPVAADAQGPIELALEKGLTIDGRVVKPDGSPAAAVQIVFCLAAENVCLGPNLARSDDHGAFHLDGLAPGRYGIEADLEGLQGHAEADAGERDVVVTLAPAEAANRGTPVVFPVHIRVVGADGSAIASAQVSLAGGSFWSTSQTANGETTIEAPVNPTGATITVNGATAADGTPLPWGQTTYGPLREGETDVTVRLVPARSVEGRVVGPDGAGVPQVKVSFGAGSSFSFFGGGDDASTRTRADGSFVLKGLGDGEYGLQAEPPPDYLKPASVTVRGGDRDVVIRLRLGARPTVTVVDAKGDPVAGATVGTEGSDGGGGASVSFIGDPFGGGTKTRADGRIRLAALEPGAAVRLTVTPPANRADLAQARIDAWIPADVTVTLAPGFVVRGRVQDVAGKPVPNASVQAGWGDGRASTVQTGPDGTFEIRNLPAGRVTLRVYLGAVPDNDRLDPDDKGDAEAVVDAGAKEVLLVVSRRASLRIVVENAPPGASEMLGVSVESAGQGHFLSLGADGTATVEGLAADEACRVFVGPTPDGLMAFRADVRPGDGELRLRLAPGKSVTGRLLAPAGATDRIVWIHDDGSVAVRGVVHGDGRYEVSGLPDGTWTLTASARVGANNLSGEARVVAGATADIELK